MVAANVSFILPYRCPISVVEGNQNATTGLLCQCDGVNGKTVGQEKSRLHDLMPQRNNQSASVVSMGAASLMTFLVIPLASRQR